MALTTTGCCPAAAPEQGNANAVGPVYSAITLDVQVLVNVSVHEKLAVVVEFAVGELSTQDVPPLARKLTCPSVGAPGAVTIAVKVTGWLISEGSGASPTMLIHVA
jgi:hypothetical protein